MINELSTESEKIGLRMNESKLNIMTNTEDQLNISVGKQQIETCKRKYIYLGQVFKLGKESQEADIERRVRQRWAAFGKLAYILKKKTTLSTYVQYSINVYYPF